MGSATRLRQLHALPVAAGVDLGGCAGSAAGDRLEPAGLAGLLKPAPRGATWTLKMSGPQQAARAAIGAEGEFSYQSRLALSA
jgi:hypothetical protein